ncbi:hypothetical protein JG687_00007204 [Phytophthora cactorum]|uniref:Uncharacterized protein n=1 Tax=Phytophthora cactorum TaxID=29920 RepID=A0A329SQ43_9STRA|nr:hypothetical protein Pcac1_g2737 [Phytophthora cactorum]KAG2843469.1 hypothetical protein PC111_g2317 [Phytophthora cactorum]KAG2845721.1 hypothetical protein PC112_g1734 [Phytophthora cactorum]KAG2868046.1 hypothetical protein PC113_g1397 [Phytophthora cactorum]KAG2928085.1 hypothetical protein PC114_g3270 [Phytophthora cactorum]
MKPCPWGYAAEETGENVYCPAKKEATAPRRVRRRVIRSWDGVGGEASSRRRIRK